MNKGLPSGSVVKYLPSNAGAVGDVGSVPRAGRAPEEGNNNPLPILAWEIYIVFFIYLFYFDTWDLSSLTRDWTHAPCIIGSMAS